jgi:putative flippase GtrA
MKQIASEFARFALVGTAGLFVDMGALFVAMDLLGLGYIAGRVVSYLAAATFTWACNRSITFAPRGSERAITQWARFLVVNSAGGAVNFAVYLFVVATLSRDSALPTELGPFIPYVGVALGSISGLVVNFTLSKRFVFR